MWCGRLDIRKSMLTIKPLSVIWIVISFDLFFSKQQISVAKFHRCFKVIYYIKIVEIEGQLDLID